ncbi:unnamed protein product [Phytomonas sp. Hart1]|nr:unnamed protein product [Phytomonas sp. Hart1]|eukprot:CCW66804.1 unnamed protein product [Phytomonas sp. isolate Hart1]
MRDDISIAFTKSNYYPPYGDQEIPGSRPADLRAFFGRKLGRRYAPVPLNAGCLNNALIATAPFTPLDAIPAVPEVLQRPQKTYQYELITTPREPNDIKDEETQGIAKSTSERPCLMGVTNYIFNTRNGGRRHYFPDICSFSKSSTEDLGSQIPKKDPMPPPAEVSSSYLCPLSGRFGTRKGRGVYNFDTDSPSPPVREALAERERERAQAEAGRALVAKPLDHSLIDLGLWSLIYPTSLTPLKTSPTQDHDGGGATGAECTINTSADFESVQLDKNTVVEIKKIVDSKSTNTQHVHSSKVNTFTASTHKRDDDSTAAAFHQARRTIEKTRMTQKAKAAARLLHEDIKLVHSLSN